MPWALAPVSSRAHGFGQRYDLPLPLWLWMTAAAASLVVTFVVLAVFRGDSAAERPRAIAAALSPLAARLRRAAQVLGLGVFLLALSTGWFGTQDPYENLIVTLVWVVWWVGFAFACALIGDVWALASPINTLHDLVDAGLRRLRWRVPVARYPGWLGAWPAIAFLLAFAWAELVWAAKDVPAALAWAMLAYAGISIGAMLLFGRRTWLAHGEAFSLVFSTFARFAPWTAPASRPRVDAAAPPSLVIFVIVMLSTVTFDGFKETEWMQRTEVWASRSAWLSRALFALSEAGMPETEALYTLVMLGFPIVFLALFLLTCRASARLAGRAGGAVQGGGTWRQAGLFIFTLVPIAVAYHLSHYLGLLLTAGQLIVPLASDPFGWGWDLFGTAGRGIDIGLASPAVVWYTAVALIVAGHVVSVVAAHRVAQRVFVSRAAATWSQVPMLVLMVAYTLLSLWILAQPIVG